MDVKVSKHDQMDTYLPAFRELVTVGKVDSVMCVYNRVNGQPGCASDFLLGDQLKGMGYITNRMAVADEKNPGVWGDSELIEIDPKTGTLMGADDPRHTFGKVASY